MMRDLFRSFLVKLLAAILIMASIGLAVGAWLHERLEAKLSALRFEQLEIDLRQNPAMEGDPINVQARLRNYGEIPIRITNLATCCGAAIVPNKSVAIPTEIAPGASIPICIRIGTLQGGGESIKRVQADGETLDGLELNSAEVLIYSYVTVPLVVFPQSSSFVVHEKETATPLRQTIVLADLWPGNGLPIKSITSTLGDKLSYQLVPAKGEIVIGSRSMHKRYDLELNLSLDPVKSIFDHTVTITPDHPKAKPVEAHLHGKIIPRCGLGTDSILFSGTKPGQRVIQIIHYRYDEMADREIKLMNTPSWLNVATSETSAGQKTLTLTCTLPDFQDTREEALQFEYGRDQRSAKVPVFLSLPAPRSSE